MLPLISPSADMRPMKLDCPDIIPCLTGIALAGR